MRRHRAHSILFCICVLALMAGCQTQGPTTQDATDALDTGPFRPESNISQMYLDKGRYPNLYSPTSYAVWVDRNVAAAKLLKDQQQGIRVSSSLASDAEFIEMNYIVVECRLESIFPDASIAYDVIGMRNIDTYLITKDGVRIRPIQTILGSHADEEPRGALRHYGRTNVLVFPKTDVITGRTMLEQDVPGVRLVIDGFNSTYYFEWIAAPRFDAEGNPIPPQAQRPGSAGKLGFSALYSKLQVLAHKFQ